MIASRTRFASSCLLVAFSAVAAPAMATDGESLWSELAQANRGAPVRGYGERWLALDEAGMVRRLSSLRTAGVDATVLALPTPDGDMQRFEVTPSVVMAPELQAAFPAIRTFEGRALDGGAANVRLETAPDGSFGAMIFPTEASVRLIERDRASGRYVTYARDHHLGSTRPTCLVHPDARSGKRHEDPSSASGGGKATGPNLRTYRAAISATGEYTDFHGGTVPLGQAAIAAAVNRLNQVFETELGIRLVLVPNNQALVYTDAATDPFTNSDGFALLDENQALIDTTIGNANYDLGHVFSTGGGGIAGLGVVCATGAKAQGVTGSSEPIDDPFYIDYVAHEIGHQLDADHTFNGTTNLCGAGNRTASSAFEPGSGTSIMGYAGLCGSENVQNRSDPYFHIRSLEQIHAFSQSGGGGTCGTVSATSNGTPVITPGTAHVIPIGTPFQLTASATDPNGDPLTYDWQQYDLGAASPTSDDNGDRPLFRVFPPTSSPTRTFPKLADILASNATFGERLPSTNRVMRFRVAVRDNRTGGGGVQWSGTAAPAVAETLVTVTTAAGPFAITNLNSAALLTGGTSQALTWNVANTAAPPVACPNVEIAFSANGGASFSVVTASTPNDGSESFTVPNATTTTGRVRVRCANGIFFDINNANLSVASDTTAPVLLSIDDGDADDAVATGTAMSYTLAFDSTIAPASVQATDFDNAGTAGITVGVPVVSGSTVTVPVTPTSAGGLRLRVPTGAVVTDLAGNPLAVPAADDVTVTVTSSSILIFANGFE